MSNKEFVGVSKPRRRSPTICVPNCIRSTNATQLEDSDYKIIPESEGSEFESARQKCQSFGLHWDLAIFNFKREYERIQAILKEHCFDENNFWVGYRDMNSTIFGQEVLGKKEGFSTSVALPTSPSRQQADSDSECIALERGRLVWRDCRAKTGYICEKHNPCESSRSSTAFNGYQDAKYFISKPKFISAEGAKAECQSLGAGWDLAIIQNSVELNDINSKIHSGCFPFWTGMWEKNGQLFGLDQMQVVNFTNWDTHVGYGFNPMPHENDEDTFRCIRMRGGLYNHGQCDDTNGFFQTEPIGYVCQNHFHADNL